MPSEADAGPAVRRHLPGTLRRDVPSVGPPRVGGTYGTPLRASGTKGRGPIILRSPHSLGGEQVEGRQAVKELLAARRRRVSEVWMTESSDPSPILGEIDRLAREAHVPVRLVSQRRLESAQGTESPQGVLAYAEPIEAVTLQDLALGRPGTKGTSASPPRLVEVDALETAVALGDEDDEDDDEFGGIVIQLDGDEFDDSDEDEFEDDDVDDEADDDGIEDEAGDADDEAGDADDGDVGDEADGAADDAFEVEVDSDDEDADASDDVEVADAEEDDVVVRLVEFVDTLDDVDDLEDEADIAVEPAALSIDQAIEVALEETPDTGTAEPDSPTEVAGEVVTGASLATAAAVARTLASPTAASAPSEQAFLVVLEGVTDPQNLGAILRSAECAGATGVALPRHRSVHVTPAVTKAAAGAVEHLPMALVAGVPSALQELDRLGVTTVGLDERGTTSIYDLDLGDRPVALVLGSESTGLSSLARRRCEVLCRIPVTGGIPSLNVSAAAAVACFEVARQRVRTSSKRS